MVDIPYIHRVYDLRGGSSKVNIILITQFDHTAPLLFGSDVFVVKVHKKKNPEVYF